MIQDTLFFSSHFWIRVTARHIYFHSGFAGLEIEHSRFLSLSLFLSSLSFLTFALPLLIIIVQKLVRASSFVCKPRAWQYSRK